MKSQKSAQQPNPVQILVNRKGDTQKKMKKGSSREGESSVQKAVRQVKRKEKKSRKITKGVEKCSEVLRLTYEKAGVKDDKDGAFISVKVKEPLDVGPCVEKVQNSQNSQLDFTPVWAVDDDGPDLLGGLKGKFWSRPSELDPDLLMENNDGNGDALGTVVAETQLDAVLPDSEANMALAIESRSTI